MVKGPTTILYLYSSLVFVLLAFIPNTTQATDTAWPAKNDFCGQILATGILSSIATPTELLHIVNSTLESSNIGESMNRYVPDKWLKSGLTTSTMTSRLAEHIPTSVVDVSRNQTYSLETGKTLAYFDHNIRGKLVAQLIVSFESPEVLFNLLNQGRGLYVQTERSYWNTFARVILHFKEGFIDTSDKYGKLSRINIM
jgi:hypothetical protein